MILFLTSSPMGHYRSPEPPDFTGLDPANGLVREIAIRKISEAGDVYPL